jgi:hypothetical protein
MEPDGQVIVRLTVPELAGVAVQDSVDFLNNMLNLNAQSTAKAMTMIISNLNTPQATLAIETIQKATESAIQDFEKIGAAAARVVAAFKTLPPTGGVWIPIAPNAGDGQTAKANTPVSIPPSVQVRDMRGNPVAGINVTFLPGKDSGSVDPPKLATDANGIATIKSWTLGKEGENTLTAQVDFAGKPSISFTATATP